MVRVRCIHDGSGREPGIKDPDGKWDLRPHRSRDHRVDDEMLATWHDILEAPDVPCRQTRMVYTVNSRPARVLDKLADAPRIGELGLQFSSGWHEKNGPQRRATSRSHGGPGLVG